MRFSLKTIPSAFRRVAQAVVWTCLTALFLSVTACSRASAEKRVADPAWVQGLGDKYWRVVRMPDRRLAAIYSGTVDGKYGIIAKYSRDNGQTWDKEQLLFPLAAEFGSPEPLIDRRGEFHFFFLKERKKQTDDDGSGMPMGIDVWYTHTSGGRTQMPPPVRIWKGYTGSMNCEVQLKSGRILFLFSYYTNCTWGNRGTGPDAFTYKGKGVCTLLYSDDNGDTWNLSPAKLKVSTPDLETDEGAIEPVAAQLKDGRVWMLLRTQYGRFYESFSKDGADWSPPRPTRILSSDSPAGLVRLDDGRIVMLWNDCLRFPYAYGSRRVLHAAVTADDGKTWRGFREVVRDPHRDEPPPPNGDHGTAYPIPCAVNDGKVISTTGLSNPDYNMIFDPAWLYATDQKEDFSHGLEDWSAYGVKGVSIEPDPQNTGGHVLAIRKIDPAWQASAVWNFPAGVGGRLHLRLLIKPGFGGARIGLTDHFSSPFDDLDKFYNLFNLDITPDGRLANGATLTPDRWVDLALNWDGRKRECRVLLDGKQVAVLPQTRDTLGVCYLRLRSTAETTDNAGFLVADIDAHVVPQ